MVDNLHHMSHHTLMRSRSRSVHKRSATHALYLIDRVFIGKALSRSSMSTSPRRIRRYKIRSSGVLSSRIHLAVRYRKLETDCCHKRSSKDKFSSNHVWTRSGDPTSTASNIYTKIRKVPITKDNSDIHATHWGTPNPRRRPGVCRCS